MAELEPMDVDGLSLASTLTRNKAVPRREGVLLESVSVRLHFGWHELRAVETDNKKYIEAPKPEVYNLMTDFAELNNIYGNESPFSLGRQIDQWKAKDDIAALKPSRIDKETVNMLEALGYVAEFASIDEGEEALPDPKDGIHRWVDLQMCQAMVRIERHAPAIGCLQKILDNDPSPANINTSPQRSRTESRKAPALVELFVARAIRPLSLL
jgi:choline-sulfatase